MPVLDYSAWPLSKGKKLPAGSFRTCPDGLRSIEIHGIPGLNLAPGPQRVTSKFRCMHKKLPVALLVQDQIQSCSSEGLWPHPSPNHLPPLIPSPSLHLVKSSSVLSLRSLLQRDPSTLAVPPNSFMTYLWDCLFHVCYSLFVSHIQCQPFAPSCIPGPRTVPNTWQVPNKCWQDQPGSHNAQQNGRTSGQTCCVCMG